MEGLFICRRGQSCHSRNKALVLQLCFSLAAAVTEKQAQPLWHGQNPLPVANRSKDRLRQPHSRQQRPLLITGRAAAALLARKRHEKFFTTIRAAHPRQPLSHIPAFEKLVHGRTNSRMPIAIFRLKPLVINALELVETVTYQPEKGRSLRIAGPIQFYRRITHARP